MRGGPLEGEALTLDCRIGRGPGGSSPKATRPRCFVYVGDSPTDEMGTESDGELRRDRRHSSFYRPEIRNDSRRGSLESKTGSLVRRRLAKPVSLTGLVGSKPARRGALPRAGECPTPCAPGYLKCLPAYLAFGPSSSWILRSSLYFASLSPRAGAPVLMKVAPKAVAR